MELMTSPAPGPCWANQNHNNCFGMRTWPNSCQCTSTLRTALKLLRNDSPFRCVAQLVDPKPTAAWGHLASYKWEINTLTMLKNKTKQNYICSWEWPAFPVERREQGWESAQAQLSPYRLWTSPHTGRHLPLTRSRDQSTEKAADSKCLPSHKYFQWKRDLWCYKCQWQAQFVLIALLVTLL